MQQQGLGQKQDKEYWVLKKVKVCGCSQLWYWRSCRRACRCNGILQNFFLDSGDKKQSSPVYDVYNISGARVKYKTYTGARVQSGRDLSTYCAG
jgi:hypothetical protein